MCTRRGKGVKTFEANLPLLNTPRGLTKVKVPTYQLNDNDTEC